MTDLRYPIGKFRFDGSLTEEQKQKFLDDIAHAPANLRAAVKGLSEQQLDTPYRPEGWTVRQVVHHVPDSHLQRLHTLQAGPHRRGTDDQALRRRPLGATGRYPGHSCRGLTSHAGFIA